MKHNILRLKKIESTNDYARKLIELYGEKPEINQSVVFADEQTAGRGMAGNKWISEAGKNLTFSIILSPADYLPVQEFFMLSKLTSVAVLKYLERKKLKPKIKWPNDIIVGDRKISGILIENLVRGNKLRYSIIGVGININQTDFPQEIKATSLKLERDSDFDLNKELARFLVIFFDLLKSLKKGKFQDIDKLYLKNLYKINQLTQFRSGGHIFEATIKGVDKYGRLILEDYTKERQIFDPKQIEYIF